MDYYSEFREKNHLIPLKIDNKQDIYRDLDNIGNSWTGRMDASFTNTFIQEAVHLITNAIVVFELGYFDCAYYSLRQSLEVSTVMNYILELPKEEKQKKFESWKKQKRFPMNNEMLKFLESNEDIYSDVFDNMSDFFSVINKTKRTLNKSVHKQGYEYFYVARNHPINGDKDYSIYIKKFIEVLYICIGAVAILRLTIDPMPVLLMDDDIFYRTGDTMTTPFSEIFVKKYIGLKNIEKYKLTEVYQNHYDYIIQEERKYESVANVVKHQYIDKMRINEILEQSHLLNKHDLSAVVFSSKSDKISKVYHLGGLLMYFTNVDSRRTKMEWSGFVFKEISEKENPINCDFDEAYISYFVIDDDLDIYIEHNEPFEESEIEILSSIRFNFT